MSAQMPVVPVGGDAENSCTCNNCESGCTCDSCGCQDCTCESCSHSA